MSHFPSRTRALSNLTEALVRFKKAETQIGNDYIRRDVKNLRKMLEQIIKKISSTFQ